MTFQGPFRSKPLKFKNLNMAQLESRFKVNTVSVAQMDGAVLQYEMNVLERYVHQDLL